MTKEQHQQGKSGRSNYELRTNELRTKANASNLHSFNSYFRKTPQASIHGLFRQFRLFRREYIQTNAEGWGAVNVYSPPPQDRTVSKTFWSGSFGGGGGQQVPVYGAVDRSHTTARTNRKLGMGYLVEKLNDY